MVENDKNLFYNVNIGDIMKALRIITAIIQKLIGIINIFLIIIIVLNLFNLILSGIQGNSYITFLDYTYRIIYEDDDYFNFKKGDFVLIDLNRTPTEKEIVLFNNNGTIELAKVAEMTYEGMKLETEDAKIETTNEQIIGTNIKTIHNLGDVISRLLSTNVLIIAIVIIVFTSIMQYILNKAQGKLKKPDFKKFNNPV